MNKQIIDVSNLLEKFKKLFLNFEISLLPETVLGNEVSKITRAFYTLIAEEIKGVFTTDKEKDHANDIAVTLATHVAILFIYHRHFQIDSLKGTITEFIKNGKPLDDKMFNLFAKISKSLVDYNTEELRKEFNDIKIEIGALINTRSDLHKKLIEEHGYKEDDDMMILFDELDEIRYFFLSTLSILLIEPNTEEDKSIIAVSIMTISTLLRKFSVEPLDIPNSVRYNEFIKEAKELNMETAPCQTQTNTSTMTA